jgi:hypothetical protein
MKFSHLFIPSIQKKSGPESNQTRSINFTFIVGHPLNRSFRKLHILSYANNGGEKLYKYPPPK